MELFVIPVISCRKLSAKFCYKISLHYSLDYCWAKYWLLMSALYEPFHVKHCGITFHSTTKVERYSHDEISATVYW